MVPAFLSTHTPQHRITPQHPCTPPTLCHTHTQTQTQITHPRTDIFITHTRRTETPPSTGREGMRATPTSRKRPQKNHIPGGCKHCNSHFFFSGCFVFFSPRKRKNPQVLEKERGYFDPARVGAVSADSSGSVSGRSAGGHAQCQQSPQQWQVRGWGPGQ